MPEDKTARAYQRLGEALDKYEMLVRTGRVTNWDYIRHLTRPPFDYCPFECGFCEELREFDACLAGISMKQTPVS